MGRSPQAEIPARDCDPRARIPNPRAQTPEPKSQTTDPNSQIPDPISQTPNPRPHIPNPTPHTPAPHSAPALGASRGTEAGAVPSPDLGAAGLGGQSLAPGEEIQHLQEVFSPSPSSASSLLRFHPGHPRGISCTFPGSWGWQSGRDSPKGPDRALGEPWGCDSVTSVPSLPSSPRPCTNIHKFPDWAVEMVGRGEISRSIYVGDSEI